MKSSLGATETIWCRKVGSGRSDERVSQWTRRHGGPTLADHHDASLSSVRLLLPVTRDSLRGP
eukprot:3646039-Rhodomonas_salina.2